MRRILKILGTVFFTFLVNACSLYDNTPNMAAEAQELMVVEMVVGGAEAADSVHKVRYIVFDNASTNPSLDINVPITITGDHRASTTFKTMLEVSSNPDKMLVAIVNEPPKTSAWLDKVTTPEGLEDMTFEMLDAFSFLYTYPADTGIPMSGVKRGISVSEENDTPEKAPKVTVHVERAVARVELWLQKENSLNSAEVNTSFQATLLRAHDMAYLVTGTTFDGTRFQTGADAWKNFGHMLTVERPIAGIIWKPETDDPPIVLDDTPKPVVAFYVPERTCDAPGDADKLEIIIHEILTSLGPRNGRIVLNEFTPQGGSSQAITEIRRNNVYRIFGRVTGSSVEFDHVIVSWVSAEENVIIDQQYYLRLSGDNFFISNDDSPFIVLAQTNYDRTDRGLSPGIRLGVIRYYDAGDVEVTDTTDPLHGWLTVEGGTEGDPQMDIRFGMSRDMASGYNGCYAVADIGAGNMTKKVKVTLANPTP